MKVQNSGEIDFKFGKVNCYIGDNSNRYVDFNDVNWLFEKILRNFYNNELFVQGQSILY